MKQEEYFRKELTYLRDLGKAFAVKNPDLAPHLGGNTRDPDVERILEGVAFLTAKLQQKLEDKLPEYAQSLMSLLAPNMLSPLPACSILQFSARANAVNDKQRIEAGTKVMSSQANEHTDRDLFFRTCSDVTLFPIELMQADCQNSIDSATITLDFRHQNNSQPLQFGDESLCLFLSDDNGLDAQLTYYWLLNYLTGIEVRVQSKQNAKPDVLSLPASLLVASGFDDKQALLPNADKSFSGYRVLQEYFQFKEKFLFIELKNIGEYLDGFITDAFSVTFHLSQPVNSHFRVSADSFRLHCTPVVNLFSCNAEVINVDHKQSEYLVKPDLKRSYNRKSDNLDNDVQIFSVDKVSGKLSGTTTESVYLPYGDTSAQQHGLPADQATYAMRYSQQVLDEEYDRWLSMYIRPVRKNLAQTVTVDNVATETLSIQLSCSNISAGKLRVNEINADCGDTPEAVQFRNISRVSEYQPPPAVYSDQWQFVSYLARHFQSLSNTQVLQELLSFFSMRKQKYYENNASEQISTAIESISSEPTVRLFNGALVNGVTTRLVLRERSFGASGKVGESRMYFFSTLLNHFFQQFVHINAFHFLVVEGLESGVRFQWQSTLGSNSPI